MANFGVKADVDEQSHLLKKLRLDIQGLTIPHEDFIRHPLLTDILATLPSKNVTLDLFVNYNYSKPLETLQLFLYTNMPQLGQLEVKLLADQVPPNVRSFSDLRLVPIKQMTLIYRDASLLQRLYSVAAVGMTAADYQKLLLSDLDKSIAQTDDPELKASFQQARQFIEKPNLIKISLSLNPSASYQEITEMSSTDAKERMKLHIISSEV
jgi:hypothetical protein